MAYNPCLDATCHHDRNRHRSARPEQRAARRLVPAGAVRRPSACATTTPVITGPCSATRPAAHQGVVAVTALVPVGAQEFGVCLVPGCGCERYRA